MSDHREKAGNRKVGKISETIELVDELALEVKRLNAVVSSFGDNVSQLKIRLDKIEDRTSKLERRSGQAPWWKPQ